MTIINKQISMLEAIYKKRIEFSGELEELSKIICRDFDLGDFLSCKIILIGYEDFNFSLKTRKGKYLVKIFSNIRTLDDCKRNVDVVVKSLEAGVFTPKLYKSEQGFLHLLKNGQSSLRLCVMDLLMVKIFLPQESKLQRNI